MAVEKSSELDFRHFSVVGRPLLVSSANPESKHGESSPAQVRKNFLGRVDLFVDAGDLPPAPPSTVVDPDAQGLVITREGAVAHADVVAAVA